MEDVGDLADTLQTKYDAALKSNLPGEETEVSVKVTECHANTCRVVATSTTSSRRRLAGSDATRRRLTHEGYEYSVVCTIISKKAADAATSGATDTATTGAVSASNSAIKDALEKAQTGENGLDTGITAAVQSAFTSGVTVTQPIFEPPTTEKETVTLRVTLFPPPPPPCSSSCTKHLDNAEASPNLCLKNEGPVEVVCRPMSNSKCELGSKSCAQVAKPPPPPPPPYPMSRCANLSDTKKRKKCKKKTKKKKKAAKKCGKVKFYRDKCALTCCLKGFNPP